MRAASDTIWSNAGWMKSANSISAIGSSPSMAIPIAMPTIPDSASGVSITRASPKSSRKPFETLKTPPRAPDVLAEQDDTVIGDISSCRVSWIAVTRFDLGHGRLVREHVARGRLGMRDRAHPRRPGSRRRCRPSARTGASPPSHRPAGPVDAAGSRTGRMGRDPDAPPPPRGSDTSCRRHRTCAGGTGRSCIRAAWAPHRRSPDRGPRAWPRSTRGRRSRPRRSPGMP